MLQNINTAKIPIMNAMEQESAQDLNAMHAWSSEGCSVLLIHYRKCKNTLISLRVSLINYISYIVIYLQQMQSRQKRSLNQILQSQNNNKEKDPSVVDNVNMVSNQSTVMECDWRSSKYYLQVEVQRHHHKFAMW